MFIILISCVFFLSIFLFSNSKIIAEKLNLFDLPKKEAIHTKKVPLVGGVIIYLLIITFFIFSNLLDFSTNNKILISLTLFFFLGLLDDKYNLSPWNRLLMSTLFLFFLIKFNIVTQISLLHIQNIGYINLEYLSIFFTILCILLLINAMNMIDGINGQSGILFLYFFLYLFYNSKFIDYEILIFIFILTIFIIFNLKEKIFAGSSGIYVLTILCSDYLIKAFENKKILYSEEIFILLILPGIDMLRLFITRIINKKNPFTKDNNHIHHILLKQCNKSVTLGTVIFLSIFPMLLFKIFINNTFLVIVIFIIIYLLILSFLKKKEIR